MSLIEMRVPIDCSGCENNVRKALQKIEGVDDVYVDVDLQKVTVMGWADREKILRAVRRTGRTAELWHYPYHPEFRNGIGHYHLNQQRQHSFNFNKSKRSLMTFHSTPSSYNYIKHGHYGSDHGYYQPPLYSTIIDEQASSVFSDENPHSCSIM